jgi:hypothetical protein
MIDPPRLCLNTVAQSRVITGNQLQGHFRQRFLADREKMGHQARTEAGGIPEADRSLHHPTTGTDQSRYPIQVPQ